MKGDFMSIWSKLNYFSANENWGDKDKINPFLLILLDKIAYEVREYAWRNNKAVPYCIIHCAYETSGHSQNSQHYRGNAADFHFENISVLEAYGIILRVLKDYQLENFVGLGVYPDWINQGFHLDVRGDKARWSQVFGKYVDIERGVRLLS